MLQVFDACEVRDARNYAVDGGQALHLHQIIVDRAKAPKCFVRAVDKGEDIAHLFDQDRARLEATARQYGVQVIVVEYEGFPNQHIDLCGKPLAKLISAYKPDWLLEIALPCDTEREYIRKATEFAVKIKWQKDAHEKNDGSPSWHRMLWGFATRAEEYTPRQRTRRDGLPFTWVEQQMIVRATTTASNVAKSTRVAKPDATYLAGLLQRSEDECKDGIRLYGPALGRKGFFDE